MRRFVTCTAWQMLLWWSNDGGWDGLGHVACMGDKFVHCLGGKSEGKRLFGNPMCVDRKVILKWEIASCVHWLGHNCPGYEHGRPSLCRLNCVHPVHCHLLYQANNSHMMSCTNQYQHCNVSSILCVCMCRSARIQLCVLKWNKMQHSVTAHCKCFTCSTNCKHSPMPAVKFMNRLMKLLLPRYSKR